MEKDGPELTPEQRSRIRWAWRQLYPTDAEWLALRDRPPNTWLPGPWLEFWQEEWDARTLGRASETPAHQKTLLRATGAPTVSRQEDLLRPSDADPKDL